MQQATAICPHCNQKIDGVNWLAQPLPADLLLRVFLCPACNKVLGAQITS